MNKNRKTGRVDFESLYQDSLQLTESIDDHGIPTLQRGIGQLDDASRLLRDQVTRSATHGEDNTLQKAHFLLAGQGFDADKLSRELNTIELKASFEPLEPLGETDIEGYLRHHHDMIIVTAIEESKTSTINDCSKAMANYLHDEWNVAKRKILEDFGYRSGKYQQLEDAEPSQNHRKRRVDNEMDVFSSTLSSIVDIPMTSTQNPPVSVCSRSSLTDIMKQYSTVVHILSESRKGNAKNSCKPISQFITVSSEFVSQADISSHSSITLRCWKLLQCIFKEDESYLVEDQFAEEYRNNSPQLVSYFTEGVIKYLQEQYRIYVENKVQAARIDIGGVPGLLPYVRAWINILIDTKKLPLACLNGVQYEGLPLWPQVYYCLRCGGLNDALDILESALSQGIPYIEESFLLVLAQKKQNIRPKQDENMKRLHQVYQRMSSSKEKDQMPFKYLLIQLYSKPDDRYHNINREFISSIEDFMWLRLETIQNLSFIGDSNNTIEALANEMESWGPDHFDSNKKNPMLYFQVLLMCQQFEKAIEFLIQRSLIVEAIHFSITFYYYGVLKSDTSSFAGHLRHYIHSFSKTDLKQAVEYIVLLREPTYKLEILKELILDTLSIEYLVGSLGSEGTRYDGLLDRYLSDEDIIEVINMAAECADINGQYCEAIELYLTSGDIQNVVRIFNVQLSQVLSPPHPSRNFWVNKAVDFTKKYVHDSFVIGELMRKQSLGLTFQLLLNLSRFFDLYAASQYQEALSFIDSQHLFPLTEDSDAINQAVHNANSLDETVKLKFHHVALAYMTCLTQLASSLKNDMPQGKEDQIASIRTRAKALVTFSGLIRCRFPEDTNSRLAKIEVMMM